MAERGLKKNPVVVLQQGLVNLGKLWQGASVSGVCPLQSPGTCLVHVNLPVTL